MQKASHPFPRARMAEALALTELFNVSVDAAAHGTPPDNLVTDPTLYTLTWFADDADVAAFTEALQTLGIATPVWEDVPTDVDYIAQMRDQFPPLTVGPFFVARNDEPAPAGLIRLAIPPNRAFGSGEHATTSNCLKAYAQLAQTRTFTNGLDFGCGSAILALAASQLQNTPCMAADNDAPSVDIAAQNAADHAQQHLLTCLHADTPAHPAIQAKAPYDLVFANILLAPLLALAEPLAQSLATGGALILSGFTTEQDSQIKAAYTAQGLRHTTSLEDNNWLAHVWTK